jgi:DNA-binding LacI/PurR family transcriptional regulator
MRSQRQSDSGHVTAREIARKLGLSQSTVSRVLSNAPGYTYSNDTRSRVLAEARRRSYRPHAVGRSLRERRTRVIGFCSRRGNLDARNSFLAEIIGSLQRGCSEKGEFLLLHNFATEMPDSEVYGELMSGRIDGLVLHADEDEPLVARLAEGALPVVAIADRIPAVPSVVCDDRDGIAQLIQHMTERGHTRIAFLRPDDQLASVRDRTAAYETEMARRGLEPLYIPVEYEASEPALDLIRSTKARPTAVCCWNDVSALVLISACRRAGVRIPDDLAIAGFDGLMDPRLMAQPLTTVAAHWPAVTCAALDALSTLRRGVEVPRETVVPVSLQIGETT